MANTKELTGLDILTIQKGLADCVEAFPAKVAIPVGKTLLNVERVSTVLQKEIQKVQKKYLLRDEEGNLVKSEDVPDAFKLVDGEAFERETNEILESKHEIEVYSIDPQDVDKLPNITLTQTKLLITLGVVVG